MMKKVLIILFTSSMPLLYAPPFSQMPAKQALTTALKQIKNDKLDFSIEIPENWEVVDQNLGVDLVGLAPLSDSDLFRENFNVLSVKLDFPLTRQEYYDYNLKSLSQLLDDFDLENSEDVKIGNVNARKIIFTHTMGVVNAKVLQYLMLINNKAYVMTFTAARLDFDKVRPEFEQIANSLKFIPK